MHLCITLLLIKQHRCVIFGSEKFCLICRRWKLAFPQWINTIMHVNILSEDHSAADPIANDSQYQQIRGTNTPLHGRKNTQWSIFIYIRVSFISICAELRHISQKEPPPRPPLRLHKRPSDWRVWLEPQKWWWWRTPGWNESSQGV